MNAPALSFTKDDLIMLATDASSPIGVRRAAADALYSLGMRDGARELSEVRNAAFPLDKPSTVPA